jgi:hypothetical protein
VRAWVVTLEERSVATRGFSVSSDPAWLVMLGSSWIQSSLRNESVLSESLSMNVFQMRGMAFIPDKSKPDTDQESDAKTYTGVNCLEVIFKQGIRWPYLTMLDILISVLMYIYSIVMSSCVAACVQVTDASHFQDKSVSAVSRHCMRFVLCLTRVTRLGYFLHIGVCCHTLDCFWKIQKRPTFLGYFFPRLSLCITYFRHKRGLATFWAIFYTNSSGHPVPVLQFKLFAT